MARVIVSAQPWFWLQPTVTGLAALLVLLGATLTVRQRHRADRKDQWWKRTQWALDLLLDGGREDGSQDAVVLGLQVLSQQALATAADDEDAQFIADVVTPLVDEYLALVDTGDEDDPDGAATDEAEEEP